MPYRNHDLRRRFGVQTGPLTGEHVIDTARLPEGVCDELRAHLVGERAPAPILARPANQGIVAGTVVAACALGLLTALTRLGFGDLDGPGQGSWGWAAIYVALAVLGTLGLLVIARPLRQGSSPPLPEGTFLFPLDLLEIEGGRIRVTPFGDARFAEIDEAASMVVIEYASGRTVTIKGKQRSPVSLLAELLAAQHDVEEATACGTVRSDILGALRGDWEAVAPRKPERRWTIVTPVRCVAVALAVTAGGTLWWGRTLLSDEKAFATALRLNDDDGFQRYLDVGGSHEDEAIDLRCALILARERREASGDILALDRVEHAPRPSPLGSRSAMEFRSASLERQRLCRVYVLHPDTEDPRDAAAKATACAGERFDADLERFEDDRSYSDLFVLLTRTTDDQHNRAQRALADLLRADDHNIDGCTSGAAAEALHALVGIARVELRVAKLEIVGAVDLRVVAIVARSLVPSSIDVLMSAPDAPGAPSFGIADARFTFRQIAGTTYRFSVDGPGTTHSEQTFEAVRDPVTDKVDDEASLKPIGLLSGSAACSRRPPDPVHLVPWSTEISLGSPPRRGLLPR